MESDNAPLYKIAARSGVDLRPGSPGAAVVAAFGPVDADTVVARFAGIGPMHGTDLDATLRNLGCRTVVAVGVSLNVGLTNLVMDAVNLGYDVVVPTDAVAGVPADYAEAMLRNTIAMLATLTTTADVVAAWNRT
jgi:nicotinamidase-related amidase